MTVKQQKVILTIMALHSVTSACLVNPKVIKMWATVKGGELITDLTDEEITEFMRKEVSRIEDLTKEYLRACLKE